MSIKRRVTENLQLIEQEAR
jgi:hypothetical protein